MSLTDREKSELLSAAEKVKNSCSGIYPAAALNGESSFSGKTDTDLLGGDIIMEYDFSTPAEFRQKMEEIWERGKKPEMKVFSVPAAVALFKNKPGSGNGIRKSDGKISEYIYEF